MSNSIYFYKDRPLFGLDLGFSSVKVMQLAQKNKDHYEVAGYGVASFDPKFIHKGEVVDFEGIAAPIKEMFENSLVGSITTRRVVFSVPAAYTFSRVITLPKEIEKKDMADAVTTETQQYIPTPIEELYTDYSVIAYDKTETRILTVAVSRKIIDSYMKLAEMLNLEVVAMEPTTGATNRLFGYTDHHKVPTVLIDFGSITTDITIYDKNLVVTGTIAGGGDQYTDAIRKALNVTQEEAHTIKTKYGLNVSKRQKEIRAAIKPYMEELSKEIRRMIRYYEERANDEHKKIGQVATLGGGANVPGLSDYLTELLRLPVRSCDPWSHLVFKDIPQPAPDEKSLYITAAGLGLVSPEEPLS